MKTNFIIFSTWLFYSYVRLKEGIRLTSLVFLFLMLSFSAFSQGKFNLVWEDNFDNYNGESNSIALQPNPAHWSHEIWAPGVVNNENQSYTSDLKNSRVQNGLLTIEAHREWNGYSSARINTNNSSVAKRQTGRIEFRAKIPAGVGTWPGLWLMPSDIFKHATTCSAQSGWTYNCDAWPNSGEIDVMEHVGKEPNNIHASVHTKNANFANGNQFTRTLYVPTATTEFHLYAVEIYDNRIDFYVDTQLYGSLSKPANAGWQDWPFDQPFHAIINLAIGGSWGGPNIDNNIFPVKMEVDYIRMYEINNNNFQSVAYPDPNKPHPIPGIIEAENFDSGGQNSAYLDMDATNQGGVYRPNERVGIEACSEGGYNVGWTTTGEWLNYSVNVTQAGTYKITARTASDNLNGGSFRLENGNNNNAVIGTFNVQNSGGWQTWKDIPISNVSFSAGQNKLRLYITAGGFNINKLTFEIMNSINLPPNVSITSPANNANFTTGTNVTITANATDSDGTIAKVEFFDGAVKLGERTNSPWSYTWTGAPQGTHTITVRAIDNGNASATSAAISISVNAAVGTIIPGKIEAENWTTMSGVQTESTTDVNGGSDVGWMDAGDWMDYLVYVQSAGTYTVEYRVAATSNSGQIQLRNGSTVLATNNIPSTGGWQSWTTITANVNLSAGSQTLRLYAGAAGFNVNWINFKQSNSGATIPGKIEAEKWTAVSGVQTESTTDVNGGSDVGWIDAGDWMDYLVYVQSAGTYTVEYRVAATSNSGQIQLRNGSTVLATNNIPSTGGWQSWTTITANVNLSAGSQTLRLYAGAAGFNVNWINFKAGAFRTGKIFSEPSSESFNETSSDALVIYPNPATETLTVEGANNALVTIFDLNGLEVLASKDKNLAIGFLPAGIYMVKVITSEGIQIRKFIKN